MGAELLRKICGVGSSQGLVFKSSEVGQSISIKGRMESSLRTLIRKKSTGTESSLTTHCRPVQSEPWSLCVKPLTSQEARGDGEQTAASTVRGTQCDSKHGSFLASSSDDVSPP